MADCRRAQNKWQLLSPLIATITRTSGNNYIPTTRQLGLRVHCHYDVIFMAAVSVIYCRPTANMRQVGLSVLTVDLHSPCTYPQTTDSVRSVLTTSRDDGGRGQVLSTVDRHLLITSSSFVYCMMGNFYARQHICYSAYMPWQFRLSVCPSVCPSHVWISQKRRITQFSPYSSPIPLVFRG